MVKSSEIVILAMKPQYLDDAIKSFESIPTHKLFISILAGISIKTLNEVSRKNLNYYFFRKLIFTVVSIEPPTNLI